MKLYGVAMSASGSASGVALAPRVCCINDGAENTMTENDWLIETNVDAMLAHLAARRRSPYASIGCCRAICRSARSAQSCRVEMADATPTPANERELAAARKSPGQQAIKSARRARRHWT